MEENKVENQELDKTIDKVKELVGLLEKANKLIQSLGNVTINNYSE